MHARRLAVILLQAVHTDIALTRLRVLREDERQRDERAAVIRPALEDWNLIEIRVLRLDDFLARRVLDVLREVDRTLDHRDHRDDAHLVLQGDVRQLHHLAQLVRDIVELLNAEGHGHALIAAEGIHEDRHLGALDVLEEQCDILLALHLGHAVRDLCDLELRVYLCLDALQEALALEVLDEFAQIFISQKNLSFSIVSINQLSLLAAHQRRKMNRTMK